MELHIYETLTIRKRIQPTKGAETVVVSHDDPHVYFTDEKADVSLRLHIDELRAIMRLFDPASPSSTLRGAASVQSDDSERN